MPDSPGVDTLNAMIAIALDGASTLAKGADIVRDQRLKLRLASLAAERDAVVARLQEEVRGLGGVPEDRGTVVGSAHRLYTEVKLALDPSDRRAVIEEIQRSEERVREKFEDFLSRDTSLPRAVRETVELQFEQIRRACNEVHGLSQDGVSDAASTPGAPGIARRSRRGRAVQHHGKAEEHARMTTKQRNEGEGNKTAAKQYNEATKKFTQSGKVHQQADKAAAARSGDERRRLDQAEAAGKRRAKEEDPQLHRDYAKSD